MISLKRFAKNRIATNITINWSEAVAVEKFQEEQFSAKEQDIVNNEGVVYIFVGENQTEDETVDVGQTKRKFEVRIKEHLREGDYLENFPNNQKVYCGDVSAGVLVDRDLLEQVEGIIIKTISQKAKKKELNICNDLKRISYKKRYKIEEIWNNNLQDDLKDILEYYMLLGDKSEL